MKQSMKLFFTSCLFFASTAHAGLQVYGGQSIGGGTTLVSYGNLGGFTATPGWLTFETYFSDFPENMNAKLVDINDPVYSSDEDHTSSNLFAFNQSTITPGDMYQYQVDSGGLDGNGWGNMFNPNDWTGTGCRFGTACKDFSWKMTQSSSSFIKNDFFYKEDHIWGFNTYEQVPIINTALLIALGTLGIVFTRRRLSDPGGY